MILVSLSCAMIFSLEKFVIQLLKSILTALKLKKIAKRHNVALLLKKRDS